MEIQHDFKEEYLAESHNENSHKNEAPQSPIKIEQGF